MKQLREDDFINFTIILNCSSRTLNLDNVQYPASSVLGRILKKKETIKMLVYTVTWNHYLLKLAHNLSKY